MKTIEINYITGDRCYFDIVSGSIKQTRTYIEFTEFKTNKIIRIDLVNIFSINN